MLSTANDFCRKERWWVFLLQRRRFRESWVCLHCIERRSSSENWYSHICFVGNSIDSDHNDKGWGNPVSGIDGCIYCPPYNARYILKYDPHVKQTSLVGDDFGNASSKWNGGSLASNSVVYCLPDHAERILSIDPWKEYTMSLENNMEQHPEQLGCIFNPNDDIPNETNFARAVTKFGKKKVLKALKALKALEARILPPEDQVCAISNLYPFVIAASYKSSDISVIYHLLRHAPSFVHYTNGRANNASSGKRKIQNISK